MFMTEMQVVQKQNKNQALNNNNKDNNLAENVINYEIWVW